jgi:transposase-like protein
MRGRRPLGPALVAALAAPRGTRERLQVVLETLTGRLTLEAAARQLGLGRTRVLVLRRQALRGAAEALAPRPVGRPPRDALEPPPAVARLEARVRELELALQAALVRTDVALTMPFLAAARRRGKKRRRRGGASGARASRPLRARRRGGPLNIGSVAPPVGASRGPPAAG